MLEVALTGDGKTVADGVAWLRHWRIVQGHSNYSVNSWLDWFWVPYPCLASRNDRSLDGGTSCLSKIRTTSGGLLQDLPR